MGGQLRCCLTSWSGKVDSSYCSLHRGWALRACPPPATWARRRRAGWDRRRWQGSDLRSRNRREGSTAGSRRQGPRAGSRSLAPGSPTKAACWPAPRGPAKGAQPRRPPARQPWHRRHPHGPRQTSGQGPPPAAGGVRSLRRPSATGQGPQQKDQVAIGIVEAAGPSSPLLIGRLGGKTQPLFRQPAVSAVHVSHPKADMIEPWRIADQLRAAPCPGDL